MRVFMFKPKFVPDVAAGKKRQTMRLHARCVPGDTLSLRHWEGRAYRSKQVHIMDAVCTRVVPVIIDRHGIVFAGKDLAPDEAAVFAAADGFDTEDEMIAFFEAEHGLPFRGDLVCWEPKTALLRRCDSCGCMTAVDLYNCPKNKAEMIIPYHTVEEVTQQEAIDACKEYKPCKCVKTFSPDVEFTGEIVEIGDCECLEGDSGIVIKTTPEALMLFRDNLVFAPVRVAIRTMKAVEAEAKGVEP